MLRFSFEKPVFLNQKTACFSPSRRYPTVRRLGQNIERLEIRKLNHGILILFAVIMCSFFLDEKP